MPCVRNRSRVLVRALAWLTLALYAAIVTLLVLSYTYPTWGINPRATYLLYFPPQLFAALYVGLMAFAVSALLGLVCAVTSRSAGHDGWAKTFAIMTALALQGPSFIGVELYSRPHVSLPPVFEVACVAVSAAAFLSMPVLGLVFARSGLGGGA